MAKSAVELVCTTDDPCDNLEYHQKINKNSSIHCQVLPTFRRILCNLIGSWVENGEYPADEKFLGQIVQDVCYYNAKRYLEI